MAQTRANCTLPLRLRTHLSSRFFKRLSSWRSRSSGMDAMDSWANKRSIGMPEISNVMMGTYASGTPYHRTCNEPPGQSKRTMVTTHRNRRHTLHLTQHWLQDVEKVFSGYLTRNNAESVYVGARTVDTEAVRAERVDIPSCCSRSGFGEATSQ